MRSRDQADPLIVRHPSLVIEVLSESTADDDRDEKLADYRKLERLREYVLVDARHQRVNLYRRGEGGAWSIVSVGAEGTVTFEPVELTVAVATIYDDTSVPVRREPHSAERR